MSISKELTKLNVESLANLFPYRIYDEKKSVFINQKSVMKIAEIPLLSGASEKLIKDLVSCINKNINETVYVRFFRITHRHIQKRLSDIMSGFAQTGGVYADIAAHQMDYIRYAAVHGFNHNSALKTAVLDSHVFLELSLKSCAQNQDEKIDSLNRLFSKIKIDLQTSNISTSVIGDRELLSLIRAFLHFDNDSIAFNDKYDDHLYLNEQLSRIGQEIDIADDHLLFKFKNKKHKTTTYTLSKLPKAYALFNTPDYLASIDKLACITCPHIFSVAFKLIADDKAKGTARSKYFSLEKQVNSMMVKLFPKLRDQFNEWSKVREELDRDEIKMAEVYIAVSLFSDEKKHNEYCAQFENTMKSCAYGGFEVQAPREIQLPLFLSNFPGLIADSLWQDLKRAYLVRKMTTWNLVNLLPLLGDWKGSYTGFIAPGLRNQMAAIDIFSDQIPTDNNNIAIAAGSGAGKSVLTQAMIYDVLSHNGVVYIIDKGDSYKKLCKLLGGVYIDGKDLRLNPFTYLDQIQDKEVLSTYFSLIRDLIATIVSPKGDLDSVSRAYLLEAAFRAYECDKSKTNIDSVVRELKKIDEKNKGGHANNGESDKRLSDLMILLKEYMTTGIYGQFFNEASQIDPNAKLIVLELGSIEANDDLLRSVLFTLINNISQRMYLSDRSLKKMCIIDEAWALLTGANKLASGFIEKGFRTSRKHGGSFVTITQGVTDYFKDDCGYLCWILCDHKIKRACQDYTNQDTC